MRQANRAALILLTSILLLLAIGCGRKEEAPATQQTPGSAASESAQQGDAQRPNPAGEAVATPEPAPTDAAPDAAMETVPPATGTRPAQPTPAKPVMKDPNVFTVRFDTTKGPIDMEIHKDWAPLGAARFRELVEAGFFDGARFFRVVPGFVVQFGIAANPMITSKWENTEFKDDPVLQSNTRGMISFATAGPNTRTTQLFINLADNQRLDGMGFSPIGRVVRGMDIVDSIDSRYGEAPRQPRIEDEGEAYLEREFPYLDKIRSAKVIN